MTVFRGCVVVVALMAAACSTGGDDSTAASGQASSYSASLQTHYTGSRSVLELEVLRRSSRADSAVLVEGTIVDVKKDRGWVNLDESEIQNGIDTREVAFDSPEAMFRTILVGLDVDSVMRDGDTVRTQERRGRISDGGVIELTLVLFNETPFDTAVAELTALERVIVPVVETDRGSYGRVLEPQSGSDLIIDVEEDDELSLPLASDETARMVLGKYRSRTELARDMAASRSGE